MKSPKPSHKPTFPFRHASGFSLLSLLIAVPADAANRWWDGGSGNWAGGSSGLTRWSTVADAATPDPGSAPGINDDLFFNITTANTTASTLSFAGGNRLAKSITFSTSGTTVFRGGGASTVSVTLTVGSGGITVNPGAGAVTIGQTPTSYGTITVALGTTDQIWTNNSNSALTIVGPMTGSANLEKQGTGNLVFSGAGTSYSGTLTVTGGKLINSLAADRPNSMIVVNDASATFGVSIANDTDTMECLDLTVAAAGTLEFNFGAVIPSTSNPPLTVTNFADFTEATPAVSVVVSAGLPPGTYPLMTWGSVSGTTPTTADLTVSNLPLGSAAALGTDGNTLNLVITAIDPFVIKDNNNTDLSLGASWVGGNVPTTGQSGKWTNLVNSANSTLLGSDLALGGLVIEDPAGPVTIGGTHTLTLGAGGINMGLATTSLTLDCPLALAGAQVWDVGFGQTLAVNGGVSGSQGVTMQGQGTVTLQGANSWAGATTVAAGTLKLGASEALPNGAGKGKLTLNGVLDLNGFDESVNGFEGGGFVDVGIAAATSTLTVGDGNQGGTFFGTLENTGASSVLGLTKTGSASITLSGMNTHAGPTIINSGALVIQNASALGTTAAGTEVNGTSTGGTGNARLELQNNITVTGEAVAIKGAGNFLGALTSASGDNLWTGNVTLAAADTRLGASAGATLRVSGAIDSGSDPFGPIIRTSDLTGVVVLSGVSTYLGSTRVVIGKLQLDGGNNRLPVGTTLEFASSTTNPDAELDLNGVSQEVAGITLTGSAVGTKNSVNNASPTLSTLTVHSTSPSTFGGILKGNLALTKTGPESLSLAGTNSYTDLTTVSAGKLFVNGDQSTATGAVSVAANATLGGTGIIGGDVTIADNGQLEFGLTTPAISHDRLELAAGRSLTLSGASTLTITSSGGAEAGLYTLVSAPDGISGSVPATVNLPLGWTADPPAISGGTDLVINITSTGTQSYASWSGGAAADLDSNNDGVPNAIAWALGAADVSENAIGLLPDFDNDTDPVYAIFTFERSDAAAADPGTTIEVQYGSDLNGWTPAVHDGDNVVIQTTEGDPKDGITVKLKRSTLAIDGRIFARLKVTVAP